MVVTEKIWARRFRLCPCLCFDIFIKKLFVCFWWHRMCYYRSKKTTETFDGWSARRLCNAFRIFSTDN